MEKSKPKRSLLLTKFEKTVIKRQHAAPTWNAQKKWKKSIVEAKKEGESVGGIVECIALNFPAGVGEPLFDALDADLAKAVFAVPAVKGVEFGSGFKSAELTGSENNDAFLVKGGKVVTATEHAGGILGGLSSGMPIVIRVAIKPTPSIGKEQKTVNLSSMKDANVNNWR